MVPRKSWIIRKAKKELVKALKTVKQFVNKNSINQEVVLMVVDKYNK